MEYNIKFPYLITDIYYTTVFYILLLYRVGSTFGGPAYCQIDDVEALHNHNGFLVPQSPISSTTSMGSMEILDTPVLHPFSLTVPTPLLCSDGIGHQNEPSKTPTIHNINNQNNNIDVDLSNHQGFFGPNKVQYIMNKVIMDIGT